jgi:phosphoribosylamine--glycine ligase
MGSYAPVVWVDEELWHTLEQKMIIPTIRGLQKEGIFYKGVLYLGLIINDGVPYLLEYNARWGDPEAQALLPLLETPLLELILSLIEGRSFEVIWSKKACVCIVLASDGYPFSYKKGMLIEGLQEAEKDALIFHAGTEKEGEQFFTTGGRVLSVVGVGEDLRSARKKAYDACALINFDGMHYRRDIADVGEG